MDGSVGRGYTLTIPVRISIQMKIRSLFRQIIFKSGPNEYKSTIEKYILGKPSPNGPFPASFFLLFFVFSIQSIVKFFTNVWIRTTDLWCWKGLFCLLNHCPRTIIFCRNLFRPNVDFIAGDEALLGPEPGWPASVQGDQGPAAVRVADVTNGLKAELVF